MDVARLHNSVAPVVRRLADAGSRVSLFIEPDTVQIAVAEAIGAPVVELHTGKYVEHVFGGNVEEAELELGRLRDAAQEGARRGIEVHAGHGLTFDTVKPVAAIPHLKELNIGHFLMGEAIFVGLDVAIKKMRSLMDEARA